MPCPRNIVFQGLTVLYANALQAAYNSLVGVSRDLSSPIAAQAPEATPAVKLIEGADRLVHTKGNIFGQQEVDATLECRVAASVENPGLSQDRINEMEAVIDQMFDAPIVIAGAGSVIVNPNGDRRAFAGASEGFISYPIRVRFDRQPGPTEVING